MLHPDQKKELLQLYPILSEVDQRLLDQSLSNAKVVTVKQGTRMFDESDPCNTFPFILSGKVRVYKESVNGRELSLYTVESGDTCIVSTGCLLSNEGYTASSLVKEDTELLMMSSHEFDELLSTPAFRKFIFSLVSKRIVELLQLVEEVAFQKLDRRLASILLHQEGPLLKISHQELADELGTVREIISRLLHSFSDNGLVRLGRGIIEILDEPALKKFLAD